ncbi:MAG: DUF2878 family protein [Pseudomonadota bacterium]
MINLVCFKLSWVLLVWGQQSGCWPAILLLLGSLALHPAASGALRSLFAVALTGVLVDQLLTSAGLFVFSEKYIPAWLIVLWLHFGLVLPQGLRFLAALPRWLQVATGALAGPLSYFAGQQLGAVDFGLSVYPTMLLLATVWAMLLPLLLELTNICERRKNFGNTATVMLLVVAGAISNQPEARAEQTGLLPLGHATYRYLLMDIYDAQLSAQTDEFTFPQTVPFELRLTYKRSFSKEAIVTETLKQWRLQGIEPSAAWITNLESIIPDVLAGDSLSLSVDAGYSSSFSHNDTPLGTVSDPEFSKAFAGIWLDEKTTHTKFRQQLLRGAL